MTIFDSPVGTDRFSVVPGAAELGWRPSVMTNELSERRLAVAELGAQLRRLRAAAASAEASTEILCASARELAAVADRLADGPQRSRHVPPVVDDLVMGVRMFNPVWGMASPLAPPVEIELLDDGVVGRCTLDLSYEGPPAFAHGGTSAMLLDQILSMAVAITGHATVTRHLDVDYVRPVPLETPLEIRATAARTGDVEVVATGEILEGDQVLVRAEGRFVVLRPDQARRFLQGERGTGTVDR